MRKRPAVHLALAFLLGDIGIHGEGWLRFIVCLIVVCDAVTLCFLKWSRGKTVWFIFVLVSVFFFGAFRTHEVISRFDEYELITPDSRILFEGEIYKKELKNEKVCYYLQKVRSRQGRIDRLVLMAKDDDMPIGSWMAGRGSVIKMRRAENEGGFDEYRYYRSLGIGLKCSMEQCLYLERPVFAWKEYLYCLRQRVNDVYGICLPGEESGLMAMMVLGEKSGMDEQAKEMFSSVGLSHIFAISGLHISVIGMGIYRLLRKRKLSFLLSGCISAIIVTGYAYMSGMAVSAIRAVGMFLILLVGQILGEAYDTLSALGIMALIILAGNPLAIEQAAFVFSFTAVIAMVTVTQSFVNAYREVCRIRWEQKHRHNKGRRWKIRFRERLVSALLFGAVLQASTLPVVAYYFYCIPSYVVVLNLFLIPLMGILLGFGIVGGFVGSVVLFPGQCLLMPCHILLYYFESMADVFLHLPYSQWIIGRPHIWQITLYYLCLFFLTAMLRKWMDSIVEKHEMAKERTSIRRKHQREHYRGKRVTVVMLAGFLFLFAFISGSQQNEFEIVTLSVGQGDGLFVDSGMGERFFIDGGSSSENELAKYTLLPFLKSRGIGHIDVWFLTHMDMDHVSGFIEILEKGYRVKTLVLAKALEKTERYHEICRLCQRNHIKIEYVKPGDSLICESGWRKQNYLKWTVLAPESPSPFSGANENSLVLWLRYRDGKEGDCFDGIFTGDIAIEQEEAILQGGTGREWTNMLGKDQIDFLKAAHHGSNGSNGSAWLETISPAITVISAGEKNRYGHPGKEAVERMDVLGLEHLCTIDCGQISVKWKRGRILTRCFCVP